MFKIYIYCSRQMVRVILEKTRKRCCMSIIQIIKEQMNMTERERDICRYILENPEKIEEMSSRELGHATFTSAASVTRFCQKIGKRFS